MQVIADLQIHSRFSRAVSKEMTLANIAVWAKRKGIGIMATGDWMHPMWFREIERDLEETGNGLLRLKKLSSSDRPDNHGLERQSNPKTSAQNSTFINSDPYFLLATEVSSIYTQGGKGRRVHTLVWVPTLDAARKISQEMTKRGCNLLSDGRPIIGLSSIDVAELVLTAEPNALVIPAHAWTPWFSLYGSMSGFDSIGDAFGPFAKNIFAVETGLSSNPAMNWQIGELDERTILSFSDAHSGPKIGREATVFDFPDGEISYASIASAIKNWKTDKKLPHIAYTIEFFPEEGKYHYTGHRVCGVRLSPTETRKNGITCPVCGKPLTQGVMQRVNELSGRTEEDVGLITFPHSASILAPDVRLIGSTLQPYRPPFTMAVPLQEILSECIGSGVASVKVTRLYADLTDHFGSEFELLLNTPLAEIRAYATARVAEAIGKVRTGDIVVDPGYDGIFGVVKIWKGGDDMPLVDPSKEQLRIF